MYMLCVMCVYKYVFIHSYSTGPYRQKNLPGKKRSVKKYQLPSWQ